MKYYKVVKIISYDRIVVNVGAPNISVGDVMQVIVQNGDEVIDPETGTSLGRLNFVKAKLRVEVVYENMCICKNFDTSNFMYPLASFDTPNSFNVDPTQITGGYGVNETERQIKIGDVVEKL